MNFISGKPSIRIGVTGANGFVGRAVVAAIVRAGHIPVAIVRTTQADAGMDETRVVGDLMDADYASMMMGLDALVNLAARVHVTKREAPDVAERAFTSMNADLPLRLAQAARSEGVRRFVQISSVAAIMSTTPSGTIANDKSVETPQTAYGRAKLTADCSLATISSPTMPIVSLRPPAVFGTGVGAFFAMLMRAARAGLPLPVGAIDNRRSFIHVDNLAEAVVAAAESEVVGAFVVTDSAPISTADLYGRLLKLYRRPARVQYWPAPLVWTGARIALRSRAESLLGDAAFDGARFVTATGWHPRLSFEEALAQTVGTR